MLLLLIEFWCFRRPSICPLDVSPFGFFKVSMLNGLFNGKCDVTDLADSQTSQLQGRSTVNPGSPRQKNRLNAINLF
jgi:hypothetical protein